MHYLKNFLEYFYTFQSFKVHFSGLSRILIKSFKFLQRTPWREDTMEGGREDIWREDAMKVYFN